MKTGTGMSQAEGGLCIRRRGVFLKKEGAQWCFWET